MKIFFFFLITLFSADIALAQHEPLSLSGIWHYKLDSLDSGIKEKWYGQKLQNEIHLPGTLDDAGVGKAMAVDTSVMNKSVMLRLSRKHQYTGAVWYQKKIILSNRMDNASLMLERVIWRTDCWIDGRPAGTQSSLIAAQNFKLGSLNPGEHIITLRIDNRKQFDISFNDFAHAYTDGTQIIWNGVIGKIEIKNQPDLAIENLQLFPYLQTKKVTANITLTMAKATEKLVFRAQVFKGNQLIEEHKNIPFGTDTGGVKKITVNLKEAKTWDEFTPQLYRIKISLLNKSGKLIDEKTETFGFRNLTATKKELLVNGRQLFLRGTLECNIFPLTGHPPMENEGWLKVFKTAKQYGLNHLRFHSWCPPDAAFRVADSLGFYLEVELPLWSLNVGKDKPTLAYLEDEAQLIIKKYGNHPSFCFWSMGNELEGDFAWLQNLVKQLKAQDSRRLYTTTTFSFQQGHGKSPEPIDDFFVTQYTDKGWVRGQGIFNTKVPDFKTDYSKAVEDITVPLIIHEVGQYSVYPDLKEIEKYNGVLSPMNFKTIRNDLRKKGMLALSDPYLKASGMLSASLYKEEIERALKTKGVSGFQLLDLHDFPGQGTALVGVLNAFWDSKGIITADEFSRFCGPVVPLLRFEKAVYTNNEHFTAMPEVANFSAKPLNNQLIWTVADINNKIIFSGNLGKKTIAIGNGNNIGSFDIDLNSIKKPQQLIVTLKFDHSTISNSWKIWVYPQIKENGKNNQARFTTSVDSALNFLKQGYNVVLNPDTTVLKGSEGRYAPVFWSPVHFPYQPGSMGLLIDPKHPALADFPSSYYSDWQWWDLVTHSKSISIDFLPKKINPIVRVIDNFYKNRNLAALAEFNIGKGKLMLCTFDIHHNLNERPAAKQLRHSLIKYASGNEFNPLDNLSPAELKLILPN